MAAVPLKAKLRGDFLKQLEERKARWQGGKSSVRLEVPDELAWWYWVEFGTAARGIPGKASGHAYEIDPVNAEALRFPHKGAMQYRDHVDHPGIRPRRSVTRVLPDIREAFADEVKDALSKGAGKDPALLSPALVEAMERAKALIVKSLARNVRGTRELEPERGKLGGRKASEVFDEQAQVVNLSK